MNPGRRSVMQRMHRWLSAAFVLATVGSAAPAAANWPGWRGDGSGVSHEPNPPLYWSADAGIAWATELPGEGNSSPVVWGDRVFLTASTDAGKQRLVLCLDRNDGHLLWRTELPAERAPKTYVKNGYASPTPVTDGERVYAFFDSPGMVALGMQGERLWTRDLGPFKNSYNLASSPVLCGDLVIQCCDQDEGSFIAALDRKTGEERWRTLRPGMSSQFATPLVITVDGKTQVVVNGQTVIAYDPADGKAIWSCRGMRPNVTPSAVAAEDLVYVVSGRNGPAMAIDPRGTGDVTETHVRMQRSSGGPYVPSPLALPAGLLLPGDNGKVRLLGGDGQALCELRIPGHYTASPVVGDNLVYWPNEKGDVAVLRVTGESDAPRLELAAVNGAGGACMASPALTGGKLFLRTDKALLCISGAAMPAAVQTADLPGTFADLKKLLEDHPAPQGPDVALRIAIVEKLGVMKDAQSVPLLQEAALKDPHWDVGEAAAKSLAGIGQAATQALIALMGAVDWQPYLKTIAADALGQLAVPEAVPVLVKATGDRNILVRLPALQALGRIAAANAAQAGEIMPVLIAGLADREGTVRRVSVEALGRNAGAFSPGAERDDLVRMLTDAASDQNPLVTQAATAALAATLAAKAPGSANAPVSGMAPSAPAPRWLRAGPVRVKFQDGELRYLSVGAREIVRRVYFAVRDERWDTVMPVFSEVVVHAADDAFTVRLAATCSNDVAGFAWTGTIAGTAHGRITFEVNGQAQRDFKSPRVGLNVLYGAGSLAGQAYELIDKGGAVTPGEFPRLVAAKLLSQSFRTLRYTAADGMQVSVGLAAGTFGMEDQRNFGDSSYKAFSGMAFKYMDVKKSEKGSQSLTLEVRGAPALADTPAGPLRVTLGAALPGARLPKTQTSTAKGTAFREINASSAEHATADELAWGFNVAMHLPDDDTLMENIPAIVDQVKSVRAFAREARIRIEPVTFNSPYPRPGPDAHQEGPFGAAWVVRMMKHLGSAGVEKAGFDVGAGAAATALQELSKFAGSALLRTEFSGGDIPAGVEVLAVEADGQRQIWVVNLTDQPATIILAGTGAGTGAGTEVRIEREALGAAEQPEPRTAPATGGEIALDLAPFETCRLRVLKTDSRRDH